jgi:hypothetical protein
LLFVLCSIGTELKITFRANILVDSRVRVQLSPSPVDHEKNTVGLNTWFRFIQIKCRNIYNYSHSILSCNGFTQCPVV